MQTDAVVSWNHIGDVFPVEDLEGAASVVDAREPALLPDPVPSEPWLRLAWGPVPGVEPGRLPLEAALVEAAERYGRARGR